MARSARGVGFLRLRRLALTLPLGAAAVQAAVLAAIVALDATKKRGRVKRPGFPRPGSFDTTVADTAPTIYAYGEDLYRDMLSAIRGARHRVLLETYLWKDDRIGREFRDALNDAAAR